MHPNRKTIVWIGSGENKAIIQYSKKVKGLVLTSLKRKVSAIIIVKNSIELIGKNEWSVVMDDECTQESLINVSFRLIYEIQIIFQAISN